MSQQVKRDSLPWEPYDGHLCSQQAPIHMDSPYHYLQFLATKRTLTEQSIPSDTYAGEQLRPIRTSVLFYTQQRTSHMTGTHKTLL